MNYRGTFLNAQSQRPTGTGTNKGNNVNFANSYYSDIAENYNIEDLPHDNAAEQAVIGAALVMGQIPDGVNLRDDQFYREQHRIVWKCIQMLSARREVIDEITVQRELMKARRTIAPSFLTGCMAYFHPPAEGSPFNYALPLEYALQCAERVQAAFKQRQYKIRIDAIHQAVHKGRYTEAVRMLQDVAGGA